MLCALAGAAFEAKKIVAPFLSRAGLATTNQLLNAQAKQLDATLRATTKAPDKDLTVATSPGVDSVVGSEAPQPQRVMTSVVQPPNAPVLGDSAVATGLPAEVRAWVDHLCQIESERQRLTKSQVSRATSLLGGLQGSEFHAASDEDSSKNKISDATNASTEVQQTWSDLDQRFLALNPPTECVPLQIAYDRTLKETGNMVGGILNAIQSSASDQQGALNSLSQMQGKSAARVDAPAKDADTLLGALFSRYGVGKEFSISSDIGL